MSEIEISARRGRAMDAFWGSKSESMGGAVTDAVQVATTVTLTEDILAAAATARYTGWKHEAEAVARAVLEAAGFEVTE